jgi:hypothetical protein
MAWLDTEDFLAAATSTSTLATTQILRVMAVEELPRNFLMCERFLA